MDYPRARQERLIVEALPDEVLIYDEERHRAHCLNEVAAFVWRHCDGTRAPKDLATLLQAELNAPEPESTVDLALHQLRRARLLEPKTFSRSTRAPLSRRDLARVVAGGAALLVPAVRSLACGGPGAVGSCVKVCIRGVTECCPCYDGNVKQCADKRCRGGMCVNKSATNCP